MSTRRFPTIDSGCLLNALFIGLAIALSVQLNQTTTASSPSDRWQVDAIQPATTQAVEPMQEFMPPQLGLPGRREGGGCR